MGGGKVVDGTKPSTEQGMMEGIVGFARCHLRSGVIPLVKIVMVERVEETAHQKWLHDIGKVERTSRSGDNAATA